MCEFISILKTLGYRLVNILMNKAHMIFWGILHPSPVMTRLWLLALIKMIEMMEMLLNLGMCKFMTILVIIGNRLVKILMDKVHMIVQGFL